MQITWRKRQRQCHTATTLRQHCNNTASYYTILPTQITWRKWQRQCQGRYQSYCKCDARSICASPGPSLHWPRRQLLWRIHLVLQCGAVCCSVLQWLECAVTLENPPGGLWGVALQHTATPCNTLFYTVIPCTTLQHPITHCNTLYHTATHYTTLQHTTPQCNTLHHTATHRLVGYCNTPPGGLLQHTAWWVARYGVASISRTLKITGLFCKRALSKRRYSAKKRFTIWRRLLIVATP